MGRPLRTTSGCTTAADRRCLRPEATDISPPIGRQRSFGSVQRRLRICPRGLLAIRAALRAAAAFGRRDRLGSRGDRSLFDAGVEALLAATGADRRPDTLRDSDPCAVGICACRRGRSGAPCDRYCVAGPDRAELQSRLDMGHRLSVIQRGVFLVYGRRLGSGHTHPQHAETAAHTRHSILRWRPHRGWTRRGVGARGQPSERRSSCEHLRRPRPLRNVQDHRAGRH
jgi:hypothetical protein